MSLNDLTLLRVHTGPMPQIFHNCTFKTAGGAMYNAMWQKVLKSETISIDANSEIFTQGVCTCFTKSQHFQNKSPYF